VTTSGRRTWPARWADLACVAVLVAGAGVVWTARVSNPAGGFVAGVGDLFGYFLPAYTYQAARLAAGELPFWNPYQGGGVPFLAMLQPGALYPARLLLLMTSPSIAMGLSAFGHLLLGLLGTYALCRTLGTGRLAAMAAGIVFVSAALLPVLHATTLLEPGAWLPVVALALVRVLRGGGWRWVVLLGVGTAMPPLAGGYQMALYVVYALALVFVAVVLDDRAHGRSVPIGRVGRLAVAALLALATAAPQVLPTFAWSAETMRQSTRLTDAQMMPLFTAAARTQRLNAFFWRESPMQVCFLSVPVVVLAAIGVLRAGWLGVVFGASALVTAWVTLFSPWHPLFPVLKALPGFAMFRFPVRIVCLTAFFTAVTAALGTSRLGSAWPRVQPWGRVLVEAAALAVVIVLLVLPYRNALAVPWATLGHTAPDPRFLPGLVRPPDAYRAWVPGGRLDLRTGTFVRQAMRERVRVLQDYDPLSARRLGTFLAAVTGTPPPSPRDVLLFTGALLREPPIVRPDLLDVAAVRSVMTVRSEAAAPLPSGWRVRGRTGDLVTYLNGRALPRAYAVDAGRFVADEPAALQALLDRQVDVHAAVVLVGTPGDETDRTLAAAVPGPPGAARIVVDEPERVVVEVNRARPGVLVLADTFAPGWSATVDGVPRTIRQANYLVRGVVVRPGERRVEFRYRAPGFRLGAALCVATWGAVLLGLGLAARRRLRGREAV
jgi:hypothetical protein